MLRRLLRHPVDIHRRDEGPPDSDGVPTFTPDVVATKGYAEQIGASEGDDPAWTGEDYRVVLDPADGLDLTGWDRVDVAGVPYEITGGPWAVYEPHSDQVHHIELKAKRAEPGP